MAEEAAWGTPSRGASSFANHPHYSLALDNELTYNEMRIKLERAFKAYRLCPQEL